MALVLKIMLLTSNCPVPVYSLRTWQNCSPISKLKHDENLVLQSILTIAVSIIRKKKFHVNDTKTKLENISFYLVFVSIYFFNYFLRYNRFFSTIFFWVALYIQFFQVDPILPCWNLEYTSITYKYIKKKITFFVDDSQEQPDEIFN